MWLLKQLEGSKNSNHERARDVAKRPLLETQRGKMSNPTTLDSVPDLFLAPVATTVWVSFPVGQVFNSLNYVV